MTFMNKGLRVCDFTLSSEKSVQRVRHKGSKILTLEMLVKVKWKFCEFLKVFKV